MYDEYQQQNGYHHYDRCVYSGYNYNRKHMQDMMYNDDLFMVDPEEDLYRNSFQRHAHSVIYGSREEDIALLNGNGLVLNHHQTQNYNGREA